MRIAVSGAQSTGKSTLIDAFIAQRPHYRHEPEAFELCGDEVAVDPSDGPDLDGLAVLLDYTFRVVANHPSGASVLFERSPVDYLAYAATKRSTTAGERESFFAAQAPRVRRSLRNLDLVVFLPVSDHVAARPCEDEGFRRRIDEELRRGLVEDGYDLFAAPDAPAVVELPPSPDGQLAELMRRTASVTEL